MNLRLASGSFSLFNFQHFLGIFCIPSILHSKVINRQFYTGANPLLKGENITFVDRLTKTSTILDIHKLQRLEQRLADVYQSLVALQSCITVTLLPYTILPAQQRLKDQISAVHSAISSMLLDSTYLGMLVPVMSGSKPQEQETKHEVRDDKSITYRKDAHILELIKSELRFCKELRETELKFITGLCEAVEAKWNEVDATVTGTVKIGFAHAHRELCASSS